MVSLTPMRGCTYDVEKPKLLVQFLTRKENDERFIADDEKFVEAIREWKVGVHFVR